jgi:hypothetical protein
MEVPNPGRGRGSVRRDDNGLAAASRGLDRRLCGRLGLRTRRKGVDDLARLGVMELLARFVLDGTGAGFEPIDMVAQVSVLLLEVLDFFLELLFLGALLRPSGETVAAIDDAPGEGQGQRDGEECTGGTPTALHPLDGALTQWKRLVGRIRVLTE